MARETQHDVTLSDGATPGVGKLFAGRYQIEALLGRGGMGSVYRAHDSEVDEVVALKTLDAYSVSEAAVERFRREVRLARRVTHRNAARTYDLGEHDGLRFLTMEFIDGTSVREWLRRRPNTDAALDVALQVAAGLEAAHAAGIIHRDLKPGNILIEAGGRVVITDFGIARMISDDAAAQTQGLLGTPAYMAPEQVEGREIDGRADLYALALILVQMLTGKLPFRGDNPYALAMARLTRESPELESLGPIPPALLEPLERCLQRDPERRFADAAGFRAALAAAREQIDPEQLGADSLAGACEDWTTQVEAAVVPEHTLARVSPASTSSSTSRTGAQAKALAVLPFRYRGPAESDYVADVLLDELTDVLAMTRGLEVSGSGATARFAASGARDPRVLGNELGVDVVVDGSIQLAGKRLRIAARVLDVHTGFQLWSERFDGELEDVFALQDKLGKRIAEALRVELEILRHSHDGLTDPEALESYLRARQAKLRWRLHGEDGAIHHYQDVLTRVPDFRPAIAGYALAIMRAWFLPSDGRYHRHDWPTVAKQAVDRAMAEAPEFAESQVAAASWLVQSGDYRAAAEHLREALRIAPTCALAHEYLGRLQTEAAQPERGLRHLELALELDPQLDWCYADIARCQALEGDLEGYRVNMERLFARTERLHVAAYLYEMRVGAWTRDTEMIRRALEQIDPNSPDDSARTIRSYGRPLLEPYAPEALDAQHEAILSRVHNGRLRTLMHQLWAEQTAFHGDHERAIGHLQAAAELVLCDLAWLDACPLFDPLRDDPRFIDLRARVRSRCEQIWASS